MPVLAPLRGAWCGGRIVFRWLHHRLPSPVPPGLRRSAGTFLVRFSSAEISSNFWVKIRSSHRTPNIPQFSKNLLFALTSEHGWGHDSTTPFNHLSQPGSISPSGTKRSAAELMQYRKPVGGGPSGKTCPKWASPVFERTSTRRIA